MIELTEEDALARVRELKSGQLDPETHELRRREMREWRNQKIAAGEPLFPALAARRQARHEKLKPMFLAGVDGIEAAAGDNFRSWLDGQAINPEDRKEKAMAAANAAWLAAATNAKPAAVAARYDTLKASLATEWNLPASDDKTVFEGIRKKMAEQEEKRQRAARVGESAIMAALADKPVAEGWAEITRNERELLLPHGREMFEVYRQNHQKLMADRPFLQQVRGIFQAVADTADLKGPPDEKAQEVQRVTGVMAEGQRLVPPMSDEAKAAVLDWFAQLPEDKQKQAAGMVVTYASGKLGGNKAAGEQIIEQLRRGSRDVVRWLEQGATNQRTEELAQRLGPVLPGMSAGDVEYRKNVLARLEKEKAGDRRRSAAATMSRILDEIDPAKPVSPWIPNWVEQGLYDFSRSAPYTAMGFVPAVGIPGIFVATKGMRYEEYVQRGVSPEMADKMSEVSAALETPVEWLSNAMLLGKFPGLNKAIQKFTKVDPVMGKFRVGAAVGANVAGIWGQEILEENIQDATPWVVQSLSAGLGADVPEVDWKEVLHGEGGMLTGAYQSRLAGATLPMALLGGGIATVQGFNEGKAANERRQALMAMGLTDEEVTGILKISDPTKRAKAAASRIAEVQEQFAATGSWVNVDKATSAITGVGTVSGIDDSGETFADTAGEREQMEEAFAALRGEIPTITRSKDGWSVTMPDGTVVAAPDAARAVTLSNMWIHEEGIRREESTQAANAALEAGGMESLAEYFETDGAGGRTGNTFAFKTDEERTVADDIEDGRVSIDQAKRNIAVASAMDEDAPTAMDPRAWRIFGRNDVEFRRGVWRDVSTIYKGGKIDDVIEENAHGWWRWARNEGMYNLDQAEAWLRSIEKEPGQFMPDTTGMDDATREIAIDEALGAVSVAWFTGKVRNTRMGPKGIRKVLATMTAYLESILRRAAWLYKMERDGRIEGQWQEFLSRSVGLDDDLIEARLIEADQAEILDSMMDQRKELLNAARGRLPHPDDMPADDPLAGDLRQLAGNFMKLTKRKDRMGRKLAALTKEGRDFFAKKGQGDTNLDEVRMRLNEEFGFTFDTVADLFDAIDMSMRGRPTYPGGQDPFDDPSTGTPFDGGVRFSVSYTGGDDKSPRSQAWRQRAAARARIESESAARLDTLRSGGKRKMESSGGDGRNTSGLPDPLARRDKATSDGLAMMRPALDRLQRVDPWMVPVILESAIGIHGDMAALDAMAITPGEPSAKGMARILEWGTSVVNHRGVDPQSVLDAWMYLLGGNGFITAEEADGVLIDHVNTHNSKSVTRAQVMVFANTSIIRNRDFNDIPKNITREEADQTVAGLAWDELERKFVGVELKLSPSSYEPSYDNTLKPTGGIEWRYTNAPYANVRVEKILDIGATFDAWRDAKETPATGGARYSLGRSDDPAGLLARLEERVPVLDIPSVELPAGFRERQAFLLDLIQTTLGDQTVQNADSGKGIYFNRGRRGNQQAVKGARSPNVSQGLTMLRDIVEQAIHANVERVGVVHGQSELKRAKNERTSGYHWFILPVRAGDNLYAAWFNARETPRFTSLVFDSFGLADLKEKPDTMASTNSLPQGQGGFGSLMTNASGEVSLGEILANVKGELKKHLPGNSARFSIGRADKYQRRLIGAVEARMADPQARAEAFARLRTRLLAIEADFRMRAARVDSSRSGPADFDRENIARAGREVQAILGVLPPEARYRVNVGGALGKVVEAQSQRGRLNALLRLVREVDEELEYHLRKAYRETLGLLLKKAEARRNDSRKISGKLGGETHDFFDQANEAMAMSPEDAQRAAGAIEGDLINETDPKKQIDLASKLEIITTFGGLDDPTTSATRLHHALKLGEEVYQRGRMAWLTLLQERQDRVAAEAETVVTALGDPRVTLGTKSRSRIISWISDIFWGEFVSIDQLMGRLAEVTGDPAGVFRGLSDRLRHAMNDYEDRRVRRNEELRSLFRDVFGTDNSLKVAARLGALTDVKSKPGQITIRPARRVKQAPIPLDRVPGILSGAVNLGYTRSDLDEIQIEYDRYLAEAKKLRQAGTTSRQRVLHWSKLVPGQADDMSISEMEGAYLLLLWRQRDYRPALRLHGADDLTMEQIEEWISPETRQIMEWLGQRGEIEFEEIDGLHRRLFGVGLPKVENHFRGMFEHQQDKGPANPFGDNPTGEGSGLGRAGFARHRVTHRSRPKFASALQVWQAHTAEMDWWLAHADTLTHLGQLIRRPAVADALSSAVGDKIAAAVRTRLQFLENGGAEMAGGMLLFEQVVARMRAGASAAMLGLKLSTLMVQATAILGSAASTRMTGLSYLKGWAGLLANPSRLAKMWQSATLRRRLEMGTSWEVRQAMQSANFRPSQFAELARQGMLPIAYTDAAFTSISAAIAYDHGLAQAKKAGLDGGEAEASALEFMDAVVNETAQPVTSINRSTLENRWLNDPVKWLAFAFATEIRQKLAMTIVAARKLATGAGPGNRSAALRITAALALMRAMEFGIRQVYQEMSKTEDDDDDRWEDPKAWIHAILTGHLGGIPLIGQLAEVPIAAALGQPHFSGSTPWAQGLGKSIASTKKIFGEEELESKEVWESMQNILKAVGTLDVRLAPLAQLANLESAGRGIWDSATEENSEETAILDRLAKQQREAQKDRRIDLDKAEKELRAMPEGERWKALSEKHGADPDTMRELIDRLRAPALEPDEARLRKFAVEGGYRAKAIAAAARARKLQGPALDAWLNNLRAKRVLTRDTEAQLQQELANGNN